MAGLLAILFILISILDILTTQCALKKELKEYNPFLQWLYKKYGVNGHIAFKVATTFSIIFYYNVIPVEALILLNIVFLLIVINNVKVLQC